MRDDIRQDSFKEKLKQRKKHVRVLSAIIKQLLEGLEEESLQRRRIDARESLANNVLEQRMREERVDAIQVQFH